MHVRMDGNDEADGSTCQTAKRTIENALKTQMWTALIAILLIKYLEFCSRADLALCRLMAFLRLNLFSYRNLQAWLEDPFETPPEQPPERLAFSFGTASAATCS